MSWARTRIAARLLAVAALAALTAGCFQPMYAEHTDGTPALREKLMGVEVPPIDKPNASRDARIGVEIRNALAFKLYGAATGMPPTHRLVIRFTSSRSSLMVDPNTALFVEPANPAVSEVPAILGLPIQLGPRNTGVGSTVPDGLRCTSRYRSAANGSSRSRVHVPPSAAHAVATT